MNVSAKVSSPHLFSEEVLNFPGIEERLVEQSLVVQGRGSAMRIFYSSDAPLSMQVSYFINRMGGRSFNPLESLRIDSLPAGTNREMTVDLSRSPAWNPAMDEYLLHVRGPDGATVQIHDIDILPSSAFKSFGAMVHQLAVGEPMQLSSINYLHGYRIFGVSLSLIFGIFILLLLLVHVLMQKFGGKKFAVYARRSPCIFFALIAFAFLLYDARFSFDLIKVTASDTHQWLTDHEYRQLGPLHTMSDRLSQEEAFSDQSMSVALCFPWDDIYLKQLRYHLYPIPVQRAEQAFDSATHLVFLGMEHALTDGMISCHGTQELREAKLLDDYGRGSAIYHLSPEPRS